MRRRLAAVPAALAAAAIALAGCGGDDGPKSALDDALRYLPDDATLVVAVETDPDGEQWRQALELVERFAFADQLKDGVKQSLGRRQRIDFDDDLEPQLGDEFVLSLTGGGAQSGAAAWKLKDAAKAREYVEDRGREVDGPGDRTAYEFANGILTFDGDMAVIADSAELLEAALERHDGDDHLTQDEFDDALGDLDRDALIRVTGDLQAALEGQPKAAAARSVPWLGSVRRYAAVAYARDDGLALDFELQTEGATAAQLPLAPGAASPPVPRRDGEIGIAMREPARAFVFLDAVRQALPRGAEYARFQAALKRIGIDLRRDILDHLGAEAALSFTLDRAYAARADLEDAAGVASALKTIAERLPAALGPQGDTGFRIEPGGGEGFYRMTGRDGKQVFVGVVGDRLALGSEAGRARDFAEADAEPVPGARGSVAVYANAEEVADKVISSSSNPFAALFGQALTRPLGDLTGWIEAQPEGLTGHLDLKIEDG